MVILDTIHTAYKTRCRIRQVGPPRGGRRADLCPMFMSCSRDVDVKMAHFRRQVVPRDLLKLSTSSAAQRTSAAPAAGTWWSSRGEADE